MSLLAGACSRDDGEVETGGAPTTAAGGSETTAGGSGGEGDLGPGDFGDLTEVCGDGDGAGATAQGVTDESIEVGTISDPGFVGRPGLNQELFDASKVFTEWCNAAGGINGRQIELTELDAKITEYKQRITEACQSVFMLVGGGGVFDDTGQDERLSCLLPEIPAYQVSSKARGAELAAAPLPSALDQTPIAAFQYLDEKFPDSTDKVGFITGNVASTVTVDKQNQEGVKSLGWKIVYQSQYNAVGESSWTPFAQALQSEGVKGLVYTGEPENMAKLLQAIADIGYELDWVVVGANHLDAKFVELGGSAVKDVYMYSAVVPPFEAPNNPATQQYLDLFDEYSPDGKKEALLGINSFSAWLLFAQSVKECGSDVTRKCVFEAASGTSAWTGGGLHAETDPSSGEASRCGIVVVATPDGFEIPEDFERTDGLFRCAEDSLLDLEGNYGEGATLEGVGKSMDDLA
ncbi:MAG TPA: ABC transporter substrate-binding protein [Aquihabitans sp.]|nr:ABC transporter substrate-binding protein [Aquihabitans sp.]